MKLLLLAIFIGLASGQAWIPSPRPEQWWIDQHEWNKLLSETYKDIITTVFYGDSITAGWANNEVWLSEYHPLGSVNFGIGGDQTQHLIYRILNGEVTPLNPRIVVLKIGHNNIFAGTHSNDDIIRGVDTIIDSLFSFMPNTRVLLLGILPSGWISWDRILDVNSKLPLLADNQSVFFLDMWDAFNATSPSYGVVDPNIFPDGAHMSLLGYQIWANTMRHTFQYIWNLPLKN